MLNYKKTSAGRCGSLFAIVDERISSICRTRLEEDGFSVIKLPADKRLGAAVASHTDMLLFRHGDTLIGSRSYFEKNPEVFQKIKAAAWDFNIILSDEEFQPDYPRDAIFNALVIGDKIFLKHDSVSREILSYAKRQGLKIINVKQGYPACTTLAITNSFAITSDKGMAAALMREGIEALIIPECEKIKLPPYKNGFIGGAASVFYDRVYFIGNLEALPFYNTIKEKLSENGYSAVSLDPCCDELFDLGGMTLINTDKSGKSTSPKKPKSE